MPRRKEEMQQIHRNVNNDYLFVFSIISTVTMLFFSIRKKCFVLFSLFFFFLNQRDDFEDQKKKKKLQTNL